MADFHNPYNFVPAPPRENLEHISLPADGNCTAAYLPGGLGDEPPIGHDRYHPGRYSGTIRVRLTTETPLLFPDAARATDDGNGHKTYPMRTIRIDGVEYLYIPPTSIKGMFRSAYEAVTNSRMGVFAGHDDLLAFRMEAREGLRLVPARIHCENNERLARLYLGKSGMENDGSPRVINRHKDGSPNERDPMFAAWFGGDVRRNSSCEHQELVRAYVEKWQHKTKKFKLWLVCGVKKGQGDLPSEVPEQPQRQSIEPCDDTQGHWVHGYVCISNKNIKSKHDERIFFHDQDGPRHHLKLEPSHAKRWKKLIDDYRQQHLEGDGSLSPDPTDDAGKPLKWSRHIYRAKDERELNEGQLCYALVENRSGVITLLDLVPVMISRRLHQLRPMTLVSDRLMPAKARCELSPADRVFGWVSQGQGGAYRGNVRVGGLRCDQRFDQAVQHFEPELPLAILGQPKPQQGRFYVAESKDGEAQEDGRSREEVGYNNDDRGLRGRKVYPHHAGLNPEYWAVPPDRATNDPTKQEVAGSQNPFRQYVRPIPIRSKQSDKQNRSITGWIKREITFTFDLHVTNLSAVELGALVWLLNLPPKHFHRIGGGKPLGFGSVRLEIDDWQIADGKAWMAWYESLDAEPPETSNLSEMQAKYQSALEAAAKLTFDDIPFIAAFKCACHGFDTLPTHYPRTQQKPIPDGESFKWFVANDNTKDGARLSLPDLATDAGLPLSPRKSS